MYTAGEEEYYTCQLSRIMRESHACGSRIVISHIKSNNFSHLNDNRECNCLKTFKTSSEHLRNSKNNAWDWLEIFWKSLACQVFKSSKIFLHLWLSSQVVWKSSAIFGSHQKSSEVFWKLRQSSEAVGKSSEFQVLHGDEKSQAFYWKKLADLKYAWKTCGCGQH